MYYYKKNNSYMQTPHHREDMVEITQEEFDSHMAEINKRIEEEQANVTPDPTPEDRISALEEIETQQDESIATLFETIMGESEVTA